MPERSLPDKFLVAFSFAGEQRDLVRSIAEEVEKRFGPGKVFLDEWYEHYIAGDNADQTLQDIYRKRSELVVFCISKPYGNKPWSKVEFEAIRALKMQISLSTAKSDRLRILPLRVGDGDVEGISFNTICPDAREKPVAQTAELIINRLRLIRRDLDTRQLTPLEFEPFLFEKRKDFTGRTWVFEAIALWLTDQTERALLIYGSPGAGKSALVAALVNGTMSRQVLAYHCCQINEPNTLDAAMFVRSLAAMIAKRLPVYSKLVEDPIVEALEGAETDPIGAFERAILRPLNDLATPDAGHCCLLIDALDEATYVRSSNILSVLAANLSHFPTWLHLIATTRPSATLVNILDATIIDLDSHREDNLRDLRKFIETRLEESPVKEKLQAADVSVLALTEKILRASEGNVLHVVAALRAVESGQTEFGEMPLGLTNLYRSAFDRLFAKTSVDFEPTRRVLRTLITDRNLTDREIAISTGLAFDEVKEILTRLAQFLSLHHGTYMFFHTSLIEWLTELDAEGKEPTAGPYHVTLAEVQKAMLVALAPDSDEGEDRLGIKSEVEAFSSVLALKDLQPPLCLGIFGDWGTGKTFFMKSMQARIAWLCQKSEDTEKQGAETAFCSRVAQITFNAWHYVDANLWASIACRIFEGLDQFISEHSIDPDASKAQLFKRLETAREKLEEAKSATEAAKQQVNAAETQLEDLEQQRRQKTLQLEDVRVLAITQVLTDNAEVRKRLEDAAKQVGLDQLAGNVKELEEVLRGFRTISGRIQAMFLALVYGKGRGWRIAFLIGILVLIPLLGIGLENLLAYLNATGAVGKLAALVTQIAAVVAAISTWLAKNLRWATVMVDRVDKAREEADTLLRDARAKATPEEAQLQKELVSLKQKEASARTALKEAQEKVEQTEKERQKLEERANGKVLAEFIREKVSGSTYQGQLGIISTIRKDLHALRDLLAVAKRFREQPSSFDEEKAKRDQNLPRIDRIVLYIDDLDRCPEKTVIEVLQAVHLLLAFPLFIVVIGVDSRWLLRSLRHHYATLRGFEEGADLQPFDGATQFSSTPQNYLEKIIQVPFNLRRMDSRGFQRLMEDILPFKRESEDAPVQSAEQVTPTVKPPPDQGADVPKVEPDQKETNGEPQTTTAAQDRIRAGVSIGEDFDPVPEALIVTQKEVEFMAELVSLIPTPRAAKRLGNIYRLIRAGISPTELAKFLGHGNGNEQYRTVMAFLSIQVGFPLVANEIFTRIRADPNHSWAGVRAELDGEDASAETQSRRVKDWSHDSPQVWHRERSRLTNCLDGLLAKQKLTGSLDGYDGWIERVNRYSFRAVERE